MVMPFGLCNAPSTFQRNMDMIFDDMRHFTKVYMEDIVVHSISWAEHIKNVKSVLQRLRETKFLVQRKWGVRTQPEKLEALLKWPIH